MNRIVTNPIHTSKIHSHNKCGSPKMDAFRHIRQELVIEGLHPKSITTLYKIMSKYSTAVDLKSTSIPLEIKAHYCLLQKILINEYACTYCTV